MESDNWITVLIARRHLHLDGTGTQEDRRGHWDRGGGPWEAGDKPSWLSQQQLIVKWARKARSRVLQGIQWSTWGMKLPEDMRRICRQRYFKMQIQGH